MTVAPLIAMKSTKCESLEAVGKELDRRAHTYANDVDQSGRHVGYLCRAGDESPVPLEQAIERRMGELAQIAECLSVRGFLGSFKAKLAEFAENPICKAALAAGRDFMTARDGRRAEKVLVNGAREKVGEMGELSREMDEWSLLDEVGDMRGARRELDVHEAPARPRDNQVL